MENTNSPMFYDSMNKVMSKSVMDNLSKKNIPAGYITCGDTENSKISIFKILIRIFLGCIIFEGLLLVILLNKNSGLKKVGNIFYKEFPSYEMIEKIKNQYKHKDVLVVPYYVTFIDEENQKIKKFIFDIPGNEENISSYLGSGRKPTSYNGVIVYDIKKSNSEILQIIQSQQ